MKYYLGLVCLGHHDSAAALVNEDGKVLVAAEEERYSRIKFDPSFPKHSIDFCLKSSGLKISDISSIGFFFDSPSFFLKRFMFALKNPFHIKSYFLKYLKLKNYENIKSKIKSNYPDYKGKINLHHHHLCHAASVFYSSPFDKATIVSIDGVGEWETAWYGIGDGLKIKKLGSVDWPNSLGVFYASMTQFLGYKENSDEYKVMGMAPYGIPKYYKEVSKMIDIETDNLSIKLDQGYFDFPIGKYPYYNLKNLNLSLANQVFIKIFPQKEIRISHLHSRKNCQNA